MHNIMLMHGARLCLALFFLEANEREQMRDELSLMLQQSSDLVNMVDSTMDFLRRRRRKIRDESWVGLRSQSHGRSGTRVGQDSGGLRSRSVMRVACFSPVRNTVRAIMGNLAHGFVVA